MRFKFITCCIFALVMSNENVYGMTTAKNYFIGFDLGTSGARISVIEKTSNYNEVHSSATLYSEYDNPKSWTDAIHKLLKDTPKELLSNTKSICVSGTSASCVLVDQTSGKVTREAKMYNYDITHSRPNSNINPAASIHATEWVDANAPKNHATRAATSALSKLLHYHACETIKPNEVLAHQSEYVANSIFLANPKKCGAGTRANKREYVSDWHNALKLGYDVKELKYPQWLLDCLEEVGIEATRTLPSVVEPGQAIGQISSSVAETYGLSEDAIVVGGTTDSNAAFVAAAAAAGSLPKYGTAVTSLGSTLAIKMLSKTFVEDSERGVYSHRFPVLGSTSNVKDTEEEAWLVGGASNVGCAILRQENFSNKELMELDFDPSTDSPLDYYPLPKMGERFPIADGKKEPVLEPKPDSRSDYLKGILQGISNVEREGFQVLGELGASPSFPDVVWTAGGGAKNDGWLQMRQRILRDSSGTDVNVLRAENAEASFGAAILAASGFSSESGS